MCRACTDSCCMLGSHWTRAESPAPECRRAAHFAAGKQKSDIHVKPMRLLTPLGCAARIFPLKRKQMQRMRDTTGRKYTKIKREVISGNPTIQGEWTPTTHKNEKLTYTLEHASSSE